ncbi:MAG: hypothetical protein Q9191_004043 [Dirinaria sp. TL-2023a]
MDQAQMGYFDSATGAYSAKPAKQQQLAAQANARGVNRPLQSHTHQKGIYPTDWLTSPIANTPTSSNYLPPHLHDYNIGPVVNQCSQSIARSAAGPQNVLHPQMNAGGFSQQRHIQPTYEPLVSSRSQHPNGSMSIDPRSANLFSENRSVLGKRRYDPAEDVNEASNKDNMREAKRHQAVNGQYQACENVAPARKVSQPVSNRQKRQQFVHSRAPQTCGFDSAKGYASQVVNPTQPSQSYPGSGFQVDSHLLSASQPSSTQPANPKIHRNVQKEGPNHPATINFSLRLPLGTRVLLLRPGDEFAITSTIANRGPAGWEKVDRSYIDVGLPNKSKRAQMANGGNVGGQTNGSSANWTTESKIPSQSSHRSGGRGKSFCRPEGVVGNTKESPIEIWEDETSGPEIRGDVKSMHREADTPATPQAPPARQAKTTLEQIKHPRQLDAVQQGSVGLLPGSKPDDNAAAEYVAVKQQPTVGPRMVDNRGTTSAQEQRLPQPGTETRVQHAPTEDVSKSTLSLLYDFELQPLEGGYEEFLSQHAEFIDGLQNPVDNLEIDNDLPSAGLNLDETLFDGIVEELDSGILQGCLGSGLSGEVSGVEAPEKTGVVSSETSGSQTSSRATEAGPAEQRADNNAVENGDKAPDRFSPPAQATPLQQTTEGDDSLDYLFENGDEEPILTDQTVQETPAQRTTEQDDLLAYLFEGEDEEAVLPE